MAHLVTGYAGYEHIKSADDRAYNAAFFGSGQYVMESGNQFEGSIINNNTVRILDGDLLMYGGHVRIEPNTYEDLTIDTGTAGTTRVDLICMTYEKNESDGTEKAFLQVVKGTASESVASLPAYTDGNILEGAAFNQMPLYKVTIEGVVLANMEPMFVTIPTYKALAERYASEFKAACEAYLSALCVLDTLEEVDANTQEKQLAGALALKEMHAKHAEDISSLVAKTNELEREIVTNADHVVVTRTGKIVNIQFFYATGAEVAAILKALKNKGLTPVNTATTAVFATASSKTYIAFLSFSSSGGVQYGAMTSYGTLAPTSAIGSSHIIEGTLTYEIA